MIPFLLNLTREDGYEFKTEGHEFLEPLVEAMLMEGYYNLKPACYSSEEISPDVPTCWGGSPFISKFASNEMALDSTFVRPNTTVIGSDQFHRASTVYPFHHPLINGSCSLLTTGPCTFESITVTENIYNRLDDFTKLEKFQVAANEMRTKFKSRQSQRIASGETDASFHQYDEVGDRCAEIN